MIRSVGCDLPSILGPSALAIKVGSLLVEEVRWDTSSSNLIGPPPWIFLKKRYLRLVLKCPPLIIDKHYSLSCSTCNGGGANISNITKLSTLKKNLLALHLYLYPCITITNTCYTTSKLSWSHCSIRVNHHLLKGLGACYLDIMVDCSDKFCNFTVVFKVGKYQSWTIWFQIYSVEVVYHLSIISSNFKYFKIEALDIFTQDWNFSYLGILWNLHWNELQVISLPN